MFIYIENFYHNAKDLFEIVSKLEFKENYQGYEIKDFNLIPPNIPNDFSDIIGRAVVVSQDSGLFRKPYNPVHFENFNENSIFVGIVALEDTIFRTHKHKETNSTNVFNINNNIDVFVKENCFNIEKWNCVSEIKMTAGSLVLVKPWIWHYLDNKIVKVFYIEKPIENAESKDPIASTNN